MHAERHARRDRRKRRRGAIAAGQAVGDDADVMTLVGLAIGEVKDVADDPADRRAHGVENAQGMVFCGHLRFGQGRNLGKV